MKTQLLLISIFLLMLSVGCEKDLPNNNIVILPTDTFPRNMEFTVIYKGGKSGGVPLWGSGERRSYIINNDSAWNFIRSEITMPDSIATIDFDSNTVLVVLDYLKPSLPSPINVLSIAEYRDSVVVKIESICCGILHTPVHSCEIIKTTKFDKAVFLEE